MTIQSLMKTQDLRNVNKIAIQKGVRIMEWIDVNDRLPEKDGRCIVCTKNITGWQPLKHNIFISEYMFNDFIYMGWENNPVTHWMPLPEPPKERG